MTPITISQTGTGRSAVIAADSFQNPFNVGVQVDVTGTVTFSIEFTMDDIMASGFSASSAQWSAASGLSALSAAAAGALLVPCHGISINVTAGTGTATAKLVQAGVR